MEQAPQLPPVRRQRKARDLRLAVLADQPGPDGPGLGVEYDWTYIEKHRVGRDVFKA